MRIQLFSVSIVAVLLTACTTPKEEPTEEPIQIEAKEVQEAPEVSEAEALLLSYEEAAVVRDLVIQTLPQMDSEAQRTLAEALDIFSADIEALKYYVDLADREPLLDDDHRAVLELIANIEEAMELFAYVLEVLL